MSKTEEEFTVYHLTGRGCSGKGVRCRTLLPATIDKVLLSAAKQMSPDATNVELARIEQRLGVESMVAGVTRAAVASEDELRALQESAWEHFDPVNAQQLTAKDWNMLMRIYTSEYCVSAVEVDAIMGKAMRASVG